MPRTPDCVPHSGQEALSRLSTATSQPGSRRSTELTSSSGTGDQDANVSIAVRYGFAEQLASPSALHRK